jgi:hypothetical protein
VDRLWFLGGWIGGWQVWLTHLCGEEGKRTWPIDDIFQFRSIKSKCKSFHYSFQFESIKSKCKSENLKL